MIRRLVLVTGLPAAGKTTLARSLAFELGLPLLSLDVVKETLYDTLAPPDRGLLRAAALEIVWSLLPDCPRGAVVDLWVDPVRDRESVRRDLERFDDFRILEVMCVVEGAEAARRYAARPRNHGGHLPPDKATLDRIRRSAALITPLGIGAWQRVDTSAAVDLPELVQWVDRH